MRKKYPLGLFFVCNQRLRRWMPWGFLNVSV